MNHLPSISQNRLAQLIGIYLLLFVGYRLVPATWPRVDSMLSGLMLIDMLAVLVYGISRLPEA